MSYVYLDGPFRNLSLCFFPLLLFYFFSLCLQSEIINNPFHSSATEPPDLIKKEDSWKVYGSHPEEAQTIPLTSDCLELNHMTSPEAKESGKHILACRTLVFSMEDGKMDFSR